LRAPATTTSFRSLSTAVATATKTKSSRWLALGAASVLLAYAATTDAERSRFDAKACGIIAHIGDEPAVEYLLEGLHIMQNRGYDSAGIATIDESR
jgi:glucosamine--fructose-6-phosphate aminotransferase (isomerizing)